MADMYVRRGKINVRQLYSVLIALIPVVSFYQVPFLGFGLGTMIVGVTAPFALYYIFNGKKTHAVLGILIIWIGYMIIRSSNSGENMFLLFMVLLHIGGALKGSMDARAMRKTIENVSVIMAVVVLFQTLLYYTLDIQTNLLIENLLLPANKYYATRVYDGLYRPCALFLEPSHYAQYCCFGLLSVLFPINNLKANFKRAIWIALGCILTTSGMGIALCVGIFGWYVLFNKKKRGEAILSTVLWMFAGLIAYLVLMRFSFFSTAVKRVFGEVNGYNAIWGRTLYWDSYIGTMSVKDLLIGYGRITAPEGYMTGLMSTIYYYGYVGVILLAMVLLSLSLLGKDNYTICCCVIYAGMMLVSGQNGFLTYVNRLGLFTASAVFSHQALRSKYNLE